MYFSRKQHLLCGTQAKNNTQLEFNHEETSKQNKQGTSFKKKKRTLIFKNISFIEDKERLKEVLQIEGDKGNMTRKCHV